jgi:two-component system cell cycle response regulator
VEGSKTQTQIMSMPDVFRGKGGRRQPVLVVVQGEEIGRRYLLNENRLVLGRDADQAELVLPDPSVSGRHAALSVDPEEERYAIRDLESRNGTFVNGVRVRNGPLRDGDKIFVGGTVLKFTFHDSIEDHFHGELDRLMNLDSLTGLYVRRWFDHEFPRAFDAARRTGRPLCVAMMDLDGLKAVNDSHGHQLGSHCISEAGRIIKQHLPAAGAAGARFGGDEFAAWFSDATLDDVWDVAETIRRRIEAFDFRQGDVVVEPTVSIGVAELSPDVLSAEELLRMADEALYRAKKKGRNTVSR